MRAEIISKSPEQTRMIGELIGRLSPPGTVLALRGDLGSGKTVLCQGIAAGLGIFEPVNSPSFTLINEYRGTIPFYHMDFYRLEDPKELDELGCEEYFYGDGVCAVEWAGRAESLLPESRIEVEFSAPGPEVAGGEQKAEDFRKIVIESLGEGLDSVVAGLRRELSAPGGLLLL